MELMNEEIKKLLPPLYSQEHLGLDAIVHVKYFTPFSGWTWWATEFDPEEGIFFGLVKGFSVELGYFSLHEFEECKGSIVIERDLYWEPMTLSEIKETLSRGGFC